MIYLALWIAAFIFVLWIGKIAVDWVAVQWYILTGRLPRDWRHRTYQQ